MSTPAAILCEALAKRNIALTEDLITTVLREGGLTLTDDAAHKEWEQKFRDGTLSERRIIGPGVTR